MYTNTKTLESTFNISAIVWMLDSGDCFFAFFGSNKISSLSFWHNKHKLKLNVQVANVILFFDMIFALLIPDNTTIHFFVFCCFFCSDNYVIIRTTITSAHVFVLIASDDNAMIIFNPFATLN